MEKGVLVVGLIFISIVFSFATLLMPVYYANSRTITGNGISGTVGLTILSQTPQVYILSPLNETYNFSKYLNKYTLDLNVSSSGPLTNWRYNLYDLKHNKLVNESVPFTPNSTFDAVRWSNKLTVFADTSFGKTANASVIFFVHVNNTAPLLENVSNVFVCEGNFTTAYVNATDPDEDDLTFTLNPVDPFFLVPRLSIGKSFVEVKLFSGILSKANVGVHPETISVSDGKAVDTGKFNITVIGINNPPLVSPVGVQTLYTRGDNMTLFKQLDVDDVESGNASSGNFRFNISFVNLNDVGENVDLFNISNYGVINFTANESELGNYNVSICTTDQPLTNPSPNITLCGQNGSSQTTCTKFELTITNNDRPPTIVSHTPRSLELNITSTDKLIFNITAYDPDKTTPDVYWYVDGKKKRYDSFDANSSLVYSFGCNVDGVHKVEVVATDGKLNDSLTWTLNVKDDKCVSSPPPSGGGGGGGPICKPQWGCGSFGVCRSADAALKDGILSGDDYRTIERSCQASLWLGNKCGFQIRGCTDVNNCSSSSGKPALLQACQFVQNPSCSDGVKDCHDGSCELLVDCGGPCGACATCSDGIQDGGETGIDCGGSCPNICPSQLEVQTNSALNSPIFRYGIIIIAILLFILAILLIRVLYLRRKKKKEEENGQ